MEVIEDVSFEVPDEELLSPPRVDPDLPAEESALPPSASSEVALAEIHSETPQAEALSDVVEGAEETMGQFLPRRLARSS
jgi:hypothetical protein